jgi:hypothetical protein
MNTRESKRILALILGMMVVFVSGCVIKPSAEGPGVEGGAYETYSSLSEALSAKGNTTVTLSGDETIDLTGVRIMGRKEIFLNSFSLKLTGHLAISEEGMIDIKPGEGSTEGSIDLSDLRFDVSQAPAALSHELSVIEIRPGVTLIKPQTGAGIGVREFPGTLTSITYSPAEQPAGELGQGGAGGLNHPQQQDPQQPTHIVLEEVDGGYFTVMLPEGWVIQTMGRYTTFGFRAWDPQNPDYEIFCYGNLSPLLKSYEAKSAYADYVSQGGYANAQLYADAPVIDVYDAGSVFTEFSALNALAEKYVPGFSIPILENLRIIETMPLETPYASICTSEALVFASLQAQSGTACYGKLTASIWNTQGYFAGDIDMSPTAALNVTGVIAPQTDFEAVEGVLTQAVFSLTFTEEYLREANESIQATGEAALASSAALQAIYDECNQAWDDYIRE